MSKYSPIFGTGLARSGGALYSNCLSANPEMMVACCPNLELFRSFRNDLFLQAKNKNVLAEIPENAPLQDYYGNEARIEALDIMMDATLNVTFTQSNWEIFHEISVARGALEAEDLVKHYNKLKGNTYKDIFSNLLGIIATSRNSSDRKWVGFHEAWALDAYPALARSFPNAKFIIMFRDPRAIVNSMLGVKNIDPLQVVQVMSYIRHWRKYAALALKLKQDPLFKGRLHITAHDLILTRTEEAVRGICETFGVDFVQQMLDTESYIDFSTGQTWVGNSSFEKKTTGIKASRALRWREKIDKTLLNTIEYLCGPELNLIGYTTLTNFANPRTIISDDIFKYMIEDHSTYTNWRSDLHDPLTDLGLEQVRRSLLTMSKPCDDDMLIRKTFLFREVYEALRQKNRATLLTGLPE
ncbi:sulfotransferase [Kiloniella majae]|uniref:sulfotransferase n=1 Tax=Kiloniella majae TaxID=1938558 RepID=UPI000A277874|nr:sulfotransferase [Kiloniella majae]